jgi:TonB family protein
MGASFEENSLPVKNVSWDDVQKFIQRLNAKTGKKYRLPTEAEWEYAARGENKSSGYKYSGSNNIDDVAWYGSTSGSTHAVGTKQANELGLYDMTGNVWEWCNDWYGAYPTLAQNNPTGPSSGSGHVFRGGSWNADASGCRVAYRSNYSPGSSNRNLGFRLVLQDDNSNQATQNSGSSPADNNAKTLPVEPEISFETVEEKPKFQGKEASEFIKWIYSKLVYPQVAQDNNIQGTVRVSFTVNTDGTLSDIKSIRKVDPLLEDAVIAIIKQSPKWTPGRQQKKPVRVLYQVPIIINLQ